MMPSGREIVHTVLRFRPARGAILAAVALSLATGWGPAVVSAADTSAAVERGRYLVTAMGCNDCHTPWKMGQNGPEPDMGLMLSGHPESLAMPPAPQLSMPWGLAAAATMTAWSGPWGVSFTANLTPDKETGLGNWKEEEFVAALRSGRHQGRGRPILPPMPYAAVGSLTDEDLHAVFAYLQSIPAITNRVPEPVPPASTPQK